jgi:trigger factor
LEFFTSRKFALKIETQPREDHQVKLIVEVEPQPFEDAKQRAARKLARQVKIPGFRPGKAPYPVIVRHLGEPAIIEEAVEILVNDIYPQAIKEAGIEPFGMGTLENIVSLDPPTFEFIIPKKAEVQLGDYAAIRLPYETQSVAETQIDEVLSNLRERQAVVEPVERAAQVGDSLRVRLSGERLQAGEGEDTTLVREREYPITIETEDSEHSVNWPFPGFSSRLVGLTAGDEVELEHTFPEDYEQEYLQGATAVFHARVEQVNSRTLPELDDEFASTIGDYSTLEELRTAIRQDLEKHAEEEYNQEYDEKLIEEVINISTITYPPQMLDQEIETVIDRLKGNLAQQNLDIDLYLKTRQIDMQGLREEVTPVAEARLKKSLVLLELGEAEKIAINPDELQTETNRTLDELSYYMEEKDFRRMLQTNEARSNLVSNVMVEMLIERTQERLRNIARGLVTEVEPVSSETSEDEPQPETASETESPLPLESATESSEDTPDAGSVLAEQADAEHQNTTVE